MTEIKHVSIKSDVGRLIAHGLPAKLTYDQACMREGLFNEYHIHGVVNEIVVSNLSVADHWVRAGYAHAALQDAPSTTKKLGRPRELDFFVTPTKGREGRSLAMEVKWTPSSHCSWTNVLTDIYRLKLVAMADSTTDCLFVLCGPRGEVLSLLEQVDRHSQARALGQRRYALPLRLRSDGSKSGDSSFGPMDENGRFLGGDTVREKLPLRSNGKRWVPDRVKASLAGEASVGLRKWTTAVWRIT